jgi:uncharacterized protein YcaQ
MLDISREQAKRFVLDVQGLRTDNRCKSVLDVARRIHNIQIDTISAVSRSHNLIVFNRYSDYSEGEVWNELKGGNLFEYWSHALCLLPIDSYPFYAWKMKLYRSRPWTEYKRWSRENAETIKDVYRVVVDNGPTASQDFGRRERRSKGWWDVRSERIALDYLFYIGKLMVSYRENFQRYFDLTERVLPPHIDAEPMSDDDVPDYVVTTVLTSLGLINAIDLRTYLGRSVVRELWGAQTKKIESYLTELAFQDKVEEVAIEGIDQRFFVATSLAGKLERGHYDDNNAAVAVKLLSPFDNLFRERHYPLAVWDFNYKLECYIPKSKRIFGYYVLPILDQQEMRGRIDAKVHRKAGLLELISVYLEDEEICSEGGLQRLYHGIIEFAGFHGCQSIRCRAVHPKKIAGKIEALFS